MILSNNENSFQDRIAVKMVPFGPSIRNINSLTSKLLNRPKVRSYLKSISGEELEKTKKINKHLGYYLLSCFQKMLLLPPPSTLPYQNSI
jgi:hypothetical protein